MFLYLSDLTRFEGVFYFSPSHPAFLTLTYSESGILCLFTYYHLIFKRGRYWLSQYYNSNIINRKNASAKRPSIWNLKTFDDCRPVFSSSYLFKFCSMDYKTHFKNSHNHHFILFSVSKSKKVIEEKYFSTFWNNSFFFFCNDIQFTGSFLCYLTAEERS